MKNFIKFFSYPIVIFSFIPLNDFSFLRSQEKNSFNFIDINEFHKSDTYLIGPGDLLNINFIGYEELSGDFEVMNDGNINLPLINMVYLRNLSILDAQEKIRNAFKDELVSTEIFVSIKKTKPISVSILGEVNKPGIFYFNIQKESREFLINNPSKNPKVIDAIMLAQGITERADVENVILKRKISVNSNTSYKETRLNLLNLYKDGDQIHNPELFNGDIIKIKRLDNDSILNESFVNSNIIKNSIKVSVVGQVKLPGVLNLDSRTTLSQAIFNAGGPINFSANLKDIELVRTNRDGQIIKEEFKLDLSKIDPKTNPLLKEGDIVIVKERPVSGGLDSLEKITSPFSGIANILRIFSD